MANTTVRFGASPIDSSSQRASYVVALVYVAGARNEAKGPAPGALGLEWRLVALLNGRAQADTA
jgi:hypothetical protein